VPSLNCPFCVENFVEPVEICKECQSRLKIIDRIVKTWSGELNRNLTVEVNLGGKIK